MQFDPDNKVVQLCAEGMNLEVNGKQEEAANLFMQAWDIADTDKEKFIAAHYVARHQQTIKDKLHWDETALALALKAGEEYKAHLPSFYLNIGKCYEDMTDHKAALDNYKAALSFTNCLPDDGYGKMVKAGINNGLERLRNINEAV